MKSKRSTPLVSVIVPVFNGARFLSDAIENILQQEYGPLEILIIDDGSTDATPGICARYSRNIRYERQANKGPASARNAGLGMARGEVVAFLDVDDFWPKGKLTGQVSYLLRNPQVDVVMGGVEFVQEFQETHAPIPQRSFVNAYLGSGVFRKHVFSKVGQFDPDLRYSEDHDWFLRARELGVGILVIDNIALYHRIHGQGMTSAPEAFGYQLPQVLKGSLNRRRKKSQGLDISLPRMSVYSENSGINQTLGNSSHDE